MRCKPPCLAWINKGFNVGAVVQVTTQTYSDCDKPGWVLECDRYMPNSDGELCDPEEILWTYDSNLTPINGPTVPDDVVVKEKELEVH